MNDVIDALKAMRTTAPVEVLPAVLLETGVADGFALVEAAPLPLYVAFNPAGVSCVRFAADGEDFAAEFTARFGRPAYPAPVPDRLAAQIDKALESGRPGRMRIDLSGLSEFQQAVLRKTAEILPGEVRPYGWIAKEIGRPGAVRAVGTALGNNPVPVFIPCHRVVRSDGSIGNYAFGGDVKWRLLEEEGADPGHIEELADRGVRYTGSDTTHIFCLPTCRDARRTTARHQMEFRSEVAARSAGYRPCKHCRPVAA